MVQSVLDDTRKKEFRSISVYRDALANLSPTQSTTSEQENNSSEKVISENPLIDEYFEYVAVTGRPSLSWNEIRAAFMWKIESVMNKMHAKEAEIEPDSRVREQLLKSESIQASKKFILQKAESFDGTPFTIQRLCELITTPTRHYHVTEKFLRALEKNINVVTTVTEAGERITGIDNCDPSERESPIPVERNFIVSVDELDDPLPSLTNGVVDKNPILNGPSTAPSRDVLSERTPIIDSSDERPTVSTSTVVVEESNSSISSSSKDDDENVEEAEQSHMDISPEIECNTGSAESMDTE